jgi:preprotein translocase SecF subunit
MVPTQKNLVVVGCGKLGAPLVACLANAGHKVVGIDVSKELIENLDAGIVTWNEPGLAELITKNKKNISFQENYDGAFKNTEATFIIVPTPSIASGEFSNSFVLDAVSKVGKELATDGLLALLFVVLGIVIYLSIRFEWKFALAGIIANLHDVVIILGFFAFFQWEFSLSVLAAVLAVLGYSVNESVVIFDRIRENFRKYRKMSVTAVIDNAITSTTSRTIYRLGLL